MSTVRRSIAILGLVLMVTLIDTPHMYAHGGVVIDTGFTEHFEWLVSIDPYPTLLGQATVTLLVYDILTYEPVNELAVTLYMAAPDTPRPCCQPDVHTGPIALATDPEIYPGDYSNVVTFDQPGEWALQLLATAPTAAEKSFAVVVPLTVNATMGGSQRIPITAENTPDTAATATVFAANVAAARQGNSPLSAPVSPLPTPIPPAAGAETNWLLWGGAALLPLVLVGWLILGAGPRNRMQAGDE